MHADILENNTESLLLTNKTWEKVFLSGKQKSFFAANISLNNANYCGKSDVMGGMDNASLSDHQPCFFKFASLIIRVVGTGSL